MHVRELGVERLLRPVMRSWFRSMEQWELVTPTMYEDEHVHSPGTRGYRVLVVGSGIALGWGVQTQGLALPGAIARALTSSTGVGIDVDIVVEPRMSPADAAQLLSALDLQRSDAIVLSLGVPEAVGLHSVSNWQRDLEGMLRRLSEIVPTSAGVIVTGIPSIRSIPRHDSILADIADRRARMLDTVSHEACAARGHLRFLSLVDVHVAPASLASTAYERWGSHIAAALLPLLGSGAAEPKEQRAEVGEEGDLAGDLREGRVEARRQLAVDVLPAHAFGGTARMNRLVRLAKSAFGTDTALFTVIDGDTQINSIRIGMEAENSARASSFCNSTIHARGEFVVGDALLDPHFAANPLVVGEPFIRFYAGFPVEAPGGERVGAVCVVDSRPRAADDVDVALLRELALAVQAELWNPRSTDGAADHPTVASGPDHFG